MPTLGRPWTFDDWRLIHSSRAAGIGHNWPFEPWRRMAKRGRKPPLGTLRGKAQPERPESAKKRQPLNNYERLVQFKTDIQVQLAVCTPPTRLSR